MFCLYINVLKYALVTQLQNLFCFTLSDIF